MDDLFYLRLAYQLAQDSHDPSSQNGAVLVSPMSGIIGMGNNNFPTGVQESPERWERPMKYQYVEHAERNAIFNACRSGSNTDGSTLYVPWFACSDCARAIIQAGVSEVVGHETSPELQLPHWNESCSIGLAMFDEAGVRYRWVQATFGMTVRRGEKEVTI